MTRYFELGNEDNGHTKFLYTEVARHAAAAIRSQQPLAVLANSGTAHIDYNWLEFQRNRGLLEHLDALCVHPYTNNSTPSQEVGPEKGKVYEKLTQLNDIVDAAGGMKQLWSTEYGWPNSSRPNGEHDRADLYVREMIVGDMAGLDINGLYTWDRDYGIVGRPAGVAIQTYTRMREGRRLAGFYREGGLWIAVYERDGNATAVVWTPEAGTFPNPVRGGAYFDLFGNPLSSGRAEELQIEFGEDPVYLIGSSRMAENARSARARSMRERRAAAVLPVNDVELAFGGEEEIALNLPAGSEVRLLPGDGFPAQAVPVTGRIRGHRLPSRTKMRQLPSNQSQGTFLRTASPSWKGAVRMSVIRSPS